MFKAYVKGREALVRLVRKEENGVVSFEYVVVAFCIVGAVVAVFGTGAAGTIGTALTNEINKIVALLP